MFKVKLSPFVLRGKIHHTQATQAALKIEMPKNPKKYKDQYKTIDVDGNDIWLTYQWQDDQGTTIMYVVSAKYQTKKRKR